MSSPNVWPAAMAPSGPDILANPGNYFSGTPYWVDSINGLDANAGTEPELPKKTWTSAYGAASAGDAIFLFENFSETIAAGATLAKADVLTIGMGVGSAMARFRTTVVGAMWTVTGAGQRFQNLYFPEAQAASTARLLVSTGTEVEIVESYFECGVNDAVAVSIAANNPRVEGCQFVATSARPGPGVKITAAITGAKIKDVLFDGGAYGWIGATGALNVTAGATRMLFDDVRLANRSDIIISSTGTTYKQFGVRPIDNSNCRIVIAA